ncbi:MAG: hypothetical protein NVSMB1_01970 [Polyangiales bacterium]
MLELGKDLLKHNLAQRARRIGFVFTEREHHPGCPVRLQLSIQQGGKPARARAIAPHLGDIFRPWLVVANVVDDFEHNQVMTARGSDSIIGYLAENAPLRVPNVEAFDGDVGQLTAMELHRVQRLLFGCVDETHAHRRGFFGLRSTRYRGRGRPREDEASGRFDGGDGGGVS